MCFYGNRHGAADLVDDAENIHFHPTLDNPIILNAEDTHGGHDDNASGGGNAKE